MPIYASWKLKQNLRVIFTFDKFYKSYIDGFSSITARNENIDIIKEKKPIFEIFEDPVTMAT